MPLKLPNLDDRTFKDLVDEAISHIPRCAPEWTNHNISDPGITLIELFSYITEILIFRLNCVTDENKYKFLKLINGPDWAPSEQISLTEQIRETVLEHKKISRAVTCKDFEALAAAADPKIARVRCVPRCNLEIGGAFAAGTEKPGHVSVVIVPDNGGEMPQPSPKLKARVRKELENKQLLTTRLHVVGPVYVNVGVRIRIYLKPDELESIMIDRVAKALELFFHPLKGGADGRGWPFGRDVYVSEVYELLEKLNGVDYVERNDNLYELVVDDESRLIKSGDSLVAVRIGPNELINPKIDRRQLSVFSPIQSSS